jgi:hypothetical protein
VVATNETHSVREFCEETFACLGLDWEEYVKYDARYERPAEVDLLIGDPAKARRSSAGNRRSASRSSCENHGRGRPTNRRIITRSWRTSISPTGGRRAFFASEKPDQVIVAAARVGGIHANKTYPADFLYDNLAIAANHPRRLRHRVPRLLFLGSSCIYPKHAPQPMPEDCLLTGPLEPTNEAYAIAKIAGLKLCQYYRRQQYGVLFHSAMPTNLYGPGDNYHPQNSHVMPALIRRFHEAKEAGAPRCVVWGTGTPPPRVSCTSTTWPTPASTSAGAPASPSINPPDWVRGAPPGE